jgi:hypothetical protein
VKERGITFTREMVRAQRRSERPKTQTRRVLTEQPRRAPDGLLGHSKLSGYFAEHVFGHCFARLVKCPHGQPGDRLWVREAFDAVDGGVVYRADLTDEQLDEELEVRRELRRTAKRNRKLEHAGARVWRPGRFMPRKYSRATLEIVDVRAQRVQDISGEDARAEGVQYPVSVNDCPPGKCAPLFRVDLIERAASWGIVSTATVKATRAPTHDDLSRLYFAALWDDINGKRPGCSWDANPWVWAITFKPVETP